MMGMVAGQIIDRELDRAAEEGIHQVSHFDIIVH